MIEVKVNNDRYVCFDDNGSIVKISRTVDENYENLLVDFEQVRMFAEGKESLRNYKVEYDFIEQKYILKSIEQFNESDNTQNFIYEIPVHKAQNNEISIVQNNKQQCWQLVLDPKFVEYINSQNISVDPTQQLYSVTKLYDPNVLYKTLKFDETLKVPFDSQFEFDKTSVSVYTIRKFSNYYHEVIND